MRYIVVSFVHETDLDAVSIFTPRSSSEMFLLEVWGEQNLSWDDVSFNDFFRDPVVARLDHWEEERPSNAVDLTTNILICDPRSMFCSWSLTH